MVGRSGSSGVRFCEVAPSARNLPCCSKGAQPANLPAVQPTKYYFVVNLKTATTLGLTFPQSLRLRIDELVE